MDLAEPTDLAALDEHGCSPARDVVPILHRGRVSHMLYLDNGHKKQAPTDMGEMLILTQRIGQTVEALVERKRKATR